VRGLNNARESGIRQAGAHRPIFARFPRCLRMRAVAKQSSRSAVLRPDDFPVPKKISDDHFDELCAAFHIQSSAHKQDTKRQLDALVDIFTEWMNNQKRLPDRKSDRKRLGEALSYVNKAAAIVDRLGPSGRIALEAISPFLAPMLAAKWIHESFPNNETPQRTVPRAFPGARQAARTSLRDTTYFIEEESLEARLRFVRRHPATTASAALRENRKWGRRSLASD
jgi:hypothetical protein